MSVNEDDANAEINEMINVFVIGAVVVCGSVLLSGGVYVLLIK